MCRNMKPGFNFSLLWRLKSFNSGRISFLVIQLSVVYYKPKQSKQSNKDTQCDLTFYRVFSLFDISPLQDRRCGLLTILNSLNENHEN